MGSAKLDDRRLEKCCLEFCLNRKVGSEFNVNSMRLKCLLTSNDAPLKEQTEVFFINHALLFHLSTFNTVILK